MLNLKAKNSHYVFDEKGYPIVKGDPESINDTCGRLVLMGICYGFTPEIIEKLEALLIKHKGKDRIIRHPDNPVISSRDHHSYFYIYRKYTGQKLPDFPRMRGMNLWMSSITGNKRAIWMYYALAIPFARFGNIFLRLCRRAGEIGPEWHNCDWIKKLDFGPHNPPPEGNKGWYVKRNRTPRQKFWAKIIFWTIPAYALHIKAWQLYVMPESKKKDKVKYILLKRVGLSNILVRLLLGDTTVTQAEIDNYPHMTSYRPGVYLDETCRRSIRGMDKIESEYNTYEKDLII